MQAPEATNSAGKIINLFISFLQSYQAEQMIGGVAGAFVSQQ
jgi:hypothetical protein